MAQGGMNVSPDFVMDQDPRDAQAAQMAGHAGFPATAAGMGMTGSPNLGVDIPQTGGQFTLDQFLTVLKQIVPALAGAYPLPISGVMPQNATSMLAPVKAGGMLIGR